MEFLFLFVCRAAIKGIEGAGQATHTLAVILPESNDLVDGLDRSETLALAFPDLLGVAAALGNYSEHNNRLACWGGRHVLWRRECA